MTTASKDPQIVLHGARTNNSFRAAIALEEAGLQYSVRRVDMRNGEHKGAPFLAINPAGQVPVLAVGRDTGVPFILTQSNAIMFYASDRAEVPLVAVDGPGRARTLERLFYFLGDVIAPSHYGVFLRNRGEGPGAAALTQQAVRTFMAAERFLLDSPYIAGDEFTLADIAGITFALEVSQLVPWDQVPRLQTWVERVAARPGVQRGLDAFRREG
jgi:GST-like protein